MGVKGLWSLLNPVARPVQIESLEGKRLAIDSSIWLYQFQSTMRDKDGRVLVNAHILGFLRRINRLLFHGIKPVFVFDGGAPALKRSTIAERKRRKAGASQNHAKMAEKLLAAQMRREAVRLAQEAEARREARAAQRATRVMDEEVGEQIRENEVYLEDLEGRPRPPPPPPTASTSANASGNVSYSDVVETPEQRRKRFKKHDRYQLPEVEMPSYSTESRPDARLATEAELQQFINEVAPEDIDVESPEFRALPTEVQYEIIGDLRVRSRQPSGKRLTDMLSRAPTALDFSKAQIKNLSQRNDLTQKLLTVTDMVGKAHLTIPVRVASERNRQYVLVKRGEEEGGGWALGIREGTAERPIVLEPESVPKVEESDSDYSGDIEEVTPVDDDLRQHRRREILEAIARRYAPAAPSRTLDIPAKPFGPAAKEGAKPLFEQADHVEDDDNYVIPTANDEALALALQQEELGSDEDEADPGLARALAMSRKEAEKPPSETDSDEFEEVSVPPSGAATPHEPIEIGDSDDDEEQTRARRSQIVPSEEAVDLVSEEEPTTDKRAVETGSAQSIMAALARPGKKAATSSRQFQASVAQPTASTSRPQVLKAPVEPQPDSDSRAAAALRVGGPTSRPEPTQEMSQPPTMPSSDIRPAIGESSLTASAILPGRLAPSPSPEPVMDRISSQSPEARPVEDLSATHEETLRPSSPILDTVSARSGSVPQEVSDDSDDFIEVNTDPGDIDIGTPALDAENDTAEVELEETQITRPQSRTGYDYDSDDEDAIPWSRSPSPSRREPPTEDTSMQTMGSEPASDGEMNAAEMEQEEDDYARFIAQIKNRDLNEVRTEIDDEIRILNQHTKAAMRDSDEITQSMVVQVQTLLKHFGIPYITAPMEAEAQCAKLAELDLVDGIITDDSDVFLFGGTTCFKNIFNEAKYAEVFSATDIERELSLTRERLISLSYLLGSDYTIGLPGVGPVMALELMANFPGRDGLEKFKEWWMKVQRGQDLPVEAGSNWKRRFKKRFSGTLFLTTEWLNPFVREAYLYPTTDESEEPFHWGFPRLAALRTYLHEELSWSITKVDDELTPIVQRIAQRGRGGIPRQGTLLPFFDHNAAAGANFAPRRKTTANVSKRLLAVIKEYREAEARAQGQQPTGLGEMLSGVDEANPKGVKRTNSKASVKADTANTEAEEEEESQPKPKRRKAAPKRKRSSRATSTASASEL